MLFQGFAEVGQADYYYAWIASECPTNDDLIVHESTDPNEVQLSMPIFKFKEYTTVFFHAIVKACKGDSCVSLQE